MALPQIVSRNVAQRIAEQSIKGNSAIIGTTAVTLYTVPTGKKAKILSASVVFISGGANTNLDFDMGGERFVRESSAPSPVILQDVPTAVGKELDAGDTIQLTGDSGSNNGSMNFFITFVELPA